MAPTAGESRGLRTYSEQKFLESDVWFQIQHLPLRDQWKSHFTSPRHNFELVSILAFITKLCGDYVG